jgi:type I restriction enzyme S subunit
VPQGWERRPLAACAIFRSGGTPNKARADYWDGDIPWVSSGEMAATRIYDTPLHVNREGAEAGSRLIPPNTIVIVVRGMSLAKEFRVATVAREMAFNQDLKALDCRDGVDSMYLFYSLIDQREHIRELATEASHGTKKLETAVLERLPVLVPEPRLQRLFREMIAPFVAQCDNLQYQNMRLRAARDLLLPRLMSGELAV